MDLGCGRGVLLKAFQSLGHEVIGVERKDSPCLGMPNVICSELDDIKLEAESFDIIVIWHVLEHLKEPAKTLADVSRLLKPKGSLFISVPNFGSNQATFFKKHWFHLDLPRHLYHFNTRSLVNIFKQENLVISYKNTTSLERMKTDILRFQKNISPYTYTSA